MNAEKREIVGGEEEEIFFLAVKYDWKTKSWERGRRQQKYERTDHWRMLIPKADTAGNCLNCCFVYLNVYFSRNRN